MHLFFYGVNQDRGDHAMAVSRLVESCQDCEAANDLEFCSGERSMLGYTVMFFLPYLSTLWRFTQFQNTKRAKKKNGGCSIQLLYFTWGCDHDVTTPTFKNRIMSPYVALEKNCNNPAILSEIMREIK